MPNANLGGLHLNVTAEGADEALVKVNELISVLREAKAIIEELSSMNVNVNFGNLGEKLISD